MLSYNYEELGFFWVYRIIVSIFTVAPASINRRTTSIWPF
jgi:hypothetical protein